MGLILTTEPSPAMILHEGCFESGESNLSFQETQSLAGRRLSRAVWVPPFHQGETI